MSIKLIAGIDENTRISLEIHAMDIMQRAFLGYFAGGFDPAKDIRTLREAVEGAKSGNLAEAGLKFRTFLGAVPQYGTLSIEPRPRWLDK